MLSLFIGIRRSLAAALLFLSLTLGLSSQHAAYAQPTKAQPMLPTTRLTAGMHVITAELATTPATQETGLMFRKELASNHGMLFVYAKAGPLCFWMMNTLVPLSIAFMRDDRHHRQHRRHAAHDGQQPLLCRACSICTGNGARLVCQARHHFRQADTWLAEVIMIA